jgi:hypothetical protein
MAGLTGLKYNVGEISLPYVKNVSTETFGKEILPKKYGKELERRDDRFKNFTDEYKHRAKKEKSNFLLLLPHFTPSPPPIPPVGEMVKRIMEKKESKHPLTLEDVRNIRNLHSSLTSDQIAIIQEVLKFEVERKVEEYKLKTGMEPIINPLEDITEASYRKGLKPFLRAWVRAEYLLRNDRLWREFDEGKIDYDTLLRNTILAFNELYSLIIE